jgi:hypothetical protein
MVSCTAVLKTRVRSDTFDVGGREPRAMWIVFVRRARAIIVIRMYNARILIEKRVDLTGYGEGRGRRGTMSSPCMRRRLGRKICSLVKGEMAIVTRDVSTGSVTYSGAIFGVFRDEGGLCQVEERNSAR